jgi:hypothetical protein
LPFGEAWSEIHEHNNGLLIGIMFMVLSRKGYGLPERVATDGRPFLYSKKTMDDQRKRNLEFQMDSGELHAQMATVLNLAREDATSKGWNQRHDEMLRGTIEDLMYIHDHYDLFFKSKKHQNYE